MRPRRGAAGPAESDARCARAGKRVHLDHSSIFVTKLKVELERNQRIFSKCWGMFGWEAGTRTPIRRSRVLQLGFQRRKINNLARQNNNNSGKIRNTPAIKIVKVSTAMKTQRISRSNANKIVRHCVRAMPLPFSDPNV